MWLRDSSILRSNLADLRGMEGALPEATWGAYGEAGRGRQGAARSSKIHLLYDTIIYIFFNIYIGFICYRFIIFYIIYYLYRFLSCFSYILYSLKWIEWIEFRLCWDEGASTWRRLKAWPWWVDVDLPRAQRAPPPLFSSLFTCFQLISIAFVVPKEAMSHGVVRTQAVEWARRQWAEMLLLQLRNLSKATRRKVSIYDIFYDWEG